MTARLIKSVKLADRENGNKFAVVRINVPRVCDFTVVDAEFAFTTVKGTFFIDWTYDIHRIVRTYGSGAQIKAFAQRTQEFVEWFTYSEGTKLTPSQVITGSFVKSIDDRLPDDDEKKFVFTLAIKLKS